MQALFKMCFRWKPLETPKIKIRTTLALQCYNKEEKPTGTRIIFTLSTQVARLLGQNKLVSHQAVSGGEGR